MLSCEIRKFISLGRGHREVRRSSTTVPLGMAVVCGKYRTLLADVDWTRECGVGADGMCFLDFFRCAWCHTFVPTTRA
jgi:hypothetical protein